MAKASTYLQRLELEKSKKEKIDWFKLFLQIAPAGYDVMKGYKDWQYAKIGDPSYDGVGGLIKFVGDPTTSGISVANGISKVKAHQKETGFSFSKALKDLKGKSETPVDAIKTNSVTKPTSIQMDDVYDLLTPSEKREYDSLSSNLDNPEASKALHLLLSNKRNELESQGLKVNDADDTNYIPRRKDKADQTTLMGYNKDTNQNNLELDEDGNPTGNTFEYSNETKNFSILTDPDGNPIEPIDTGIQTDEHQENLNALLGNENRDIVDPDLDNTSLTVPNKSFEVDKVEHFNPQNLPYEKYIRTLDDPDSFSTDDYHEMQATAYAAKNKLPKPVNEKVNPSLVKDLLNSNNSNVPPADNIKLDEIFGAKFVNPAVDANKGIDSSSLNPQLLSNKILRDKLGFKGIAGKGLDGMMKGGSIAGDILGAKSFFTDPVDTGDFQSVNNKIQSGRGAYNLGKGTHAAGKKILTELFLDKSKDEAAKLAAKKAAQIAGKEAGKKIAKEGAKKIAGSITPGLDILDAGATIANPDANLVQKGGSVIDTLGTLAALTGIGAPAAVPLKVIGKGVNIAGGLMSGTTPGPHEKRNLRQPGVNQQYAIDEARRKKLRELMGTSYA
tara:strand:- start:6439 stop:8280 length:1842 start_codon:yes stop_codon:yes gene_type:complete